MSTRTILVIGATGTIGGPTLDELSKRGASVRAMVHDAKHVGGLRARGIEPVVGNLGEVDSIRRALAGIERVFCLIPGNPYQPDQVQLATSFLEAMEGSDVERIVYHSMWGAGRSVNRPLVMQNHARIEDAIVQSKRGYTFLQTTFTMQALAFGQGVARSVATEGRMYTPFGDAGVALVDARDVGRAAAACLLDDAHLGKTYELSGPSVLSTTAMAAILGKVLGREVTDVPLTVEQAIGALQQLGLPEWFTSHMAVLAAFNRTGPLARVTSAVEDITGRPATTFEQLVKDHAASFTSAVA
jgi:uncharacterized protein YbjT (DUF2867 family)